MNRLNILTFPDPRLRKKAAAIDVFDQKLKDKAADMLFTMYDDKGIGLAATQVDFHHRLIVVDVSENQDDPLYLVNPSFVVLDETLDGYKEGCLSIPEHFAEIKRPTSVQVRWLDRNGNEQEQEFDGLWSTCVQHEIDHLNGKLFIDYLGTIKRQLITRKMQKFKREMERKET